MKIATFFVTATGVLTADLPMVALLELYRYQPGLMANPDQDHFLGEFLAECLFVPGLVTGVMTGSPARRRPVMAIVLGGLFALLEVIFLRVGIYRHQGWSVWYTLLLFPIFLTGIGWWLTRFEQSGYRGAHRLLVIASVAQTTWYGWALTTGAILEVWTIEFHLHSRPKADEALGVLIAHLPFYLALVYLSVRYGWLRRPAGLLSAILGLAAWFYLLKALGVWGRDHPGSQMLQAVVMVTLAYAMEQVDRWFLAQPQGRGGPLPKGTG